SCFHIERQKTVSEKIVPGTVAPVEVKTCGSQRDVCNAARFITRHLAPVVNTTGALPKIRGPCVVSVLTRSWNRVENPEEFSGFDVIAMDISGYGLIAGATGWERNHDDVTDDTPGIRGRVRRGSVIGI